MAATSPTIMTVEAAARLAAASFDALSVSDIPSWAVALAWDNTSSATTPRFLVTSSRSSHLARKASMLPS